jgi:hypothetical protein
VDLPGNVLDFSCHTGFRGCPRLVTLDEAQIAGGC